MPTHGVPHAGTVEVGSEAVLGHGGFLHTGDRLDDAVLVFSRHTTLVRAKWGSSASPHWQWRSGSHRPASVRPEADAAEYGAAALNHVMGLVTDDVTVASAAVLISASRFDWVPLVTKTTASLFSRSATIASRRYTVGSSPNTSSPSRASTMACFIAMVGR